MARGRFISKDVCKDKKVNNLRDPWAMLGFTWLITHADVEGRTDGDPELVKSLIFPRQREISVEDVERFIRQWVDAGMIDWYEVDGEKFIQFLNFEKHQVGIRRDKEPVSNIPENPAMKPATVESVPNDDGIMAENVRNDDGNSPPEVKEKLKKKLREREGEGEGEGALSPIQQMIESVVGISPGNAADLQALEEITALNPSIGDIQDAYNWLCRQGKQVKYYSSLVGPVRTSVTKREQIPKSPLDKSKAAILQVLQEIKNGVS